ncbi:MAG: carboxymuconolactone decarboxylase family protein, partial [Verrucomicrobia bacterium]|nr:carboxymuconolactone decarboxylase family protein [Verrucomicrobiota bacterium]
MKLPTTLCLLAASLLAVCQSNAQPNMELTPKQQSLVAIAAMEAKGDIEGLRKALNDGFEQGLTVSEAKEALSQLYAYTGFPRSLNALGTLQLVLNDRKAKGL